MCMQFSNSMDVMTKSNMEVKKHSKDDFLFLRQLSFPLVHKINSIKRLTRKKTVKRVNAVKSLHQ